MQAELQTNMIIVLNDNKMSISENVGGLSQASGLFANCGKHYPGVQVRRTQFVGASALRRTCGPQNPKDKEQFETAADSGHDF